MRASTRRFGRRLRRVTTWGDRPFLLALLGLVLLLAAGTLGPLQSYIAAADRVEALAAARQRLQTDVERLEDERRRLDDPAEIEVLARAELGLVKPGEIPYVVVAPEPRLDELDLPQHPEAVHAPDLPWYRRIGRAIAELIG
ncbi:MAG TPA: septum formation initiator family protein [Egibacteraceae bacterium]|nr:septum formation initiator family protein [Egibacteraceae bacterium]